MRLTLQDLKSYRPCNNYVVLRPEIDTSKFKHGSVEFYSPVSLADGKPYEQWKSQPIVCSVVSIPRRLIFGTRKVFWESVAEMDLTPEQKAYLHKVRREAKHSEITIIDVPIPGSMRWKTPIQIKQGDIVWVNSSALMRSEQQKMTVVCDQQLYYIIPYEDLYLKKDGDKVKMLNGWVLAEMIDDKAKWIRQSEQAGLVIPDTLKKKQFNDRIGVIRYIDEPVEYLFDDQYDHPEIKEGNVVMFKWRANRRLEPGAKYFAKDDDLIVTRRSNIMAILDPCINTQDK